MARFRAALVCREDKQPRTKLALRGRIGERTTNEVEATSNKRSRPSCAHPLVDGSMRRVQHVDDAALSSGAIERREGTYGVDGVPRSCNAEHCLVR